MLSRFVSRAHGVTFWAASICVAMVLAGCANPARSTLAFAADEEQPAGDAVVESDNTAQELVNDLGKMVEAWDKGDPTDAQPLVDRVVVLIDKSLDITSYQVADHAGMLFILVGSSDAARQVYAALEKAAPNATESKIGDAAKETARSGLARLDLLGTTPAIEGTLVDGEKFDWAGYKGKIVLLDFWATWCGPCIRELPNVKEMYERYHDKGFDVVGISLDDDKESLKTFIESEKLPWATIHDTAGDAGGFDKNLAKQFSVDGIPATYLVDREGKIVSISARGPSLGKQLEKLLGAP